MKNENILRKISPRHRRSYGGLLPSWLVDEWALLPAKYKQIETCPKNNEKKSPKKTFVAKTSQLIEYVLHEEKL